MHRGATAQQPTHSRAYDPSLTTVAKKEQQVTWLKLTFRSALLTVRLHSYVGIQVVQCAISLLTTIPSTLVHALDLFVASSGTLVLLGAWDGNKGVDLRQRMLLIH